MLRVKLFQKKQDLQGGKKVTVKDYLKLKAVIIPNEPNVEAVLNEDTLVDVIKSDEVLRGDYEHAIMFYGERNEVPADLMELEVRQYDVDACTLMLYV